MGQTLYLECNAGISGDMLVAALLDLGADQGVLMDALDSLPVDGFQVRVSRMQKAGLDCADFAVLLDHAHENHDHDMAYLHGEGDHAHACEYHAHLHEHAHAHGGAHAPGASHAHAHAHGHCHEHRGMAEVAAIIQQAAISPRAKDTALCVFNVLARAEAKAHGVPPDQVHFHEVGAVDSIVDVVAAAVCLDNLDVTNVVLMHLCEGQGTVRCQHGVLPVPVPAVANIVAEAGIPLSIQAMQGEFVTPTGAAIAAAIRTQAQLPERFAIQKIGLGAGKRTYERPSILRAMLIQPQEAQPASARGANADASSSATLSCVWKLETEVDDCPGEALGFVLERLFEAGAREAHFQPVFMKKNRPGYQIQALCAEADIPVLEAALFQHTTTIGIRRTPMQRTVLPREIRQAETPFGPVRVKEVQLPDGQLRAYPEYDDVAAIARAQGVPYQDVYRAVVASL